MYLPPVCTMKWSDTEHKYKDSQKVFDFRNRGSENVNRVYRGLCNTLPEVPRFICITDDSEGLDQGIEVYRMPEVLKNSVEGWRKIWMFSPEMVELAGPRICYMDIDLVITGDLSPVLCRTDPLIFTRFNTGGRKKVKNRKTGKSLQKYALLNSCFMVADIKFYSHIWESFDTSLLSLRFDRKPGYLQNYCGSDQSWLMYCLHREFTEGKVTTVGPEQGIYVFRKLPEKRGEKVLPPNSRAVAFGGKDNPGREDTRMKAEWIKEHSYGL